MANIQKQQQKQEKKCSKMHDRFESYSSVAAASSFPSACSHNWPTQAFRRRLNSHPEFKTQHRWNQELQNTQSILLVCDVAWWRARLHGTTLKRHNALTSWWWANTHLQGQQTFWKWSFPQFRHQNSRWVECIGIRQAVQSDLCYCPAIEIEPKIHAAKRTQ